MEKPKASFISVAKEGESPILAQPDPDGENDKFEKMLNSNGITSSLDLFK